MKALADKKTKIKKTKSKKESSSKKQPARQQLRAVDEQSAATGSGDGEDANESSNPIEENDDDNNNSEDDRSGAAHKHFTQEHIAQMFEGELDEFASLTSHELNNNTQRQQPMRIQYVVEDEVSGDFFRVRSNTQHRRPWGFASMGSSFSKLEAGSSVARDQQHHNRSLWSQLGSSGVIRDLETALVVMCQGILAGLCWMDAFNLSSSDGTSVLGREKDMFACTYSAVADRSRQLFFILFKYPFVKSDSSIWRSLNQVRVLPYINEPTVSLLGLMKKLSRRPPAYDEEQEDDTTWDSATRCEAQTKKLSFRLVR